MYKLQLLAYLFTARIWSLHKWMLFGKGVLGLLGAFFVLGDIDISFILKSKNVFTVQVQNALFAISNITASF